MPILLPILKIKIIISFNFISLYLENDWTLEANILQSDSAFHLKMSSRQFIKLVTFRHLIFIIGVYSWVQELVTFNFSCKFLLIEKLIVSYKSIIY